jgi:hypothetical protein
MKPSSRQSVNFCSLCKLKLEAYGQPAFKLMDTICYYFLESVPIYIDSDDERVWASVGPILAYLEAKGILVSTECTQSMVSIMPIESFVEEDGFKRFCWCDIMDV